MAESAAGAKLYRNEHRVGADECAINSRDVQNRSINDYMTFNMYRTNKDKCEDEVKKVQEFSADNHMIIRDGVGMTNGCMVDEDSKIRLGAEITNERYKEQLNTRVYHAVPNLNKGGLEALMESRLTQGESTSGRRNCQVREANVDRFIPMLSCLSGSIQNPKHIIPEWTWGGEPSRDTVRQRQFLQEQGYQFDGVAWQKKRC